MVQQNQTTGTDKHNQYRWLGKVVGTVKCKRCGWEWLPRTFDRPIVCANCHSPYWDKEKRKGDIKDGNEKML